MKITTWNVNSITVRLPQLLDWLKVDVPDIIGLQELKCDSESFPLEALQNAGYHAVVNGQKTYNGVALLSKYPIESPSFDLPNFKDDQKRVIAGTIKGIRIINIYVPNGQAPDSDKYLYKLDWLTAFIAYVKNELKTYSKLVILGDFNIAPTDDDVHNPVLWKDKILCTDKERALFNQLLSLGLVDALRIHSQPKNSFTWWDYRNQGFERDEGVRIDHLLLSKEVSGAFVRSIIHREIRGNERPSDHAPVTIVI